MMIQKASWDASDANSIKLEASECLEVPPLFQLVDEESEDVIWWFCDYRRETGDGMCLLWSYEGVWMLVWI